MAELSSKPVICPLPARCHRFFTACSCADIMNDKHAFKKSFGDFVKKTPDAMEVTLAPARVASPFRCDSALYYTPHAS